MPGVLALDLATNLGWACGPLPAKPLTYMEAVVLKPRQPPSGVFRVSTPGAPLGKFLSVYADWLDMMILTHRPKGIIIESPILPAQTAIGTVRKLMGLAGATAMAAHDHKILWCREAQPSTVKRHISGFGGPGKEHVMQAIRARGWVFSDDNEADALALHDYAGHLFAAERAAST